MDHPPEHDGLTLNRSPLEVRLPNGRVRGIRARNMLIWRGIPYAAAPVGPLRFRAPQPAPAWLGTLDASRYGAVAPQDYRKQFKGVDRRTLMSEDCLSVNVQRPADTDATGLPVMVFIHGGGYCTGSSQEFAGQGDAFVRTGGVVYVSFNYRLGALGYLDFTRFATPDRPVDSNLGLRDQVAALRWVQENIEAFGGDPGNVTVLGESAGGNAVITLLATPAASGLITRAIAQSPPSNAVYSRQLAARWGAEFVDALRLWQPAGTIDRSPIELLSTATTAELVRAALVLQLRTPDADPGTFCLAPVVDGDFLPERPLEAFRRGHAHPVPLIIGTNDREGSIFRGKVDILPRSAPRIRALFADAPRESHHLMRSVYAALPPKRSGTDFGGDFAFWFPTVQVAELHSRYAPVHLYRFDLAPRLLRMVGLDATHGVELLALYDRRDDLRVRTMTALGGRGQFRDTGERMRTHWLRFATSGYTAAGWPAYTERDRLTLIFDEVDRVESDPRSERRLAWLQFLPDL